MKYFFLCMFLISLGCSYPSKEMQNIDLNKYSIKVPTVWSIYTKDGIDSRVTGLITHLGDTIYFQYGKGVTGFNKTVKVHSLQSKVHFDSIDWPYRNEMIFSKDATVEERQGVFLKGYYRYDSIDSKRAKIMLPKVTGHGSTGIHFGLINEHGDKLTIVGNDLNLAVEQQLYKAFYSIRFK